MHVVDAVFRAGDEAGQDGFTRLPSMLLGTPDEPRALRPYTRHEVRQAEAFLRRCGLLERALHGVDYTA
jgi:hypothetical protein